MTLDADPTEVVEAMLAPTDPKLTEPTIPAGALFCDEQEEYLAHGYPYRKQRCIHTLWEEITNMTQGAPR
jgi:hypothetical protein